MCVDLDTKTTAVLDGSRNRGQIFVLFVSLFDYPSSLMEAYAKKYNLK